MRGVIVVVAALVSVLAATCAGSWADEAPAGTVAANRDAKSDKPESSKLPADFDDCLHLEH